MPFTPNLSEKTIRKQIDAEAAERGPFSLLIVDTSAAYYTGDDENDNVKLGAHARLRSFIDLPGGPTVLVTCHPTKNYDIENLHEQAESRIRSDTTPDTISRKWPRRNEKTRIIVIRPPCTRTTLVLVTGRGPTRHTPWGAEVMFGHTTAPATMAASLI
jgi:hypothetical protein